MAKLYAITAGEDSDYHIITLSSDKAKAEIVAEVFCGNVEEYDEETADATAKIFCGNVEEYDEI